MDCNMPIMDGYQASFFLKEKMREGEIDFVPIIAMTAYIGESERQKCFDHGMDDYISKPCTRDLLMKMFKKWILE
jgi:osomolarity two-component system sensor histidine kinase TcsA